MLLGDDHISVLIISGLLFSINRADSIDGFCCIRLMKLNNRCSTANRAKTFITALKRVFMHECVYIMNKIRWKIWYRKYNPYFCTPKKGMIP